MSTVAEAILRARKARSLAEFARGGGGAKSSAKGGKGSAKDKAKKAKGVAQAGSGGACCKTEGGRFAPGNNYGSLRGTNRTVAGKAKAKTGRAAAIKGIVGRSKAAAAGKAEAKKTAASKPKAKPERVAIPRTTGNDMLRLSVAKEKARDLMRKTQAAEGPQSAATQKRNDRLARLDKARSAAQYKHSQGERATAPLDPKDHISAGMQGQKLTRENLQARIKQMRADNRAAAEAKAPKAAAPAPKPASTKADRAAAMKRIAAKSKGAAEEKGYQARAKAAIARMKAEKEAAGAKPPAKPDKAARRAEEKAKAQASLARLRAEKAAEKAAAKGAPKAATTPKAAAKPEPAPSKAEAAAAKASVPHAEKPTPESKVIAGKPMEARRKELDHAFDASPGAKSNFVSLHEMRARMPELSKDEFNAVINKARDEGKINVDSHEGLHGPLTPAQREGAIVQHYGSAQHRAHNPNGVLLVWASRAKEYD